MGKRLDLIHPDLEPAMDAWLRSRGNRWQQLERGEISADEAAERLSR